MNLYLLWALQGLAVSLQAINVSIALIAPHPVPQVLFMAFNVGFQFFVNKLGNSMTPPEAQAKFEQAIAAGKADLATEKAGKVSETSYTITKVNTGALENVASGPKP